MLSELAKELRIARKENGASLEAIARPAKISTTYLQKLEQGVINNPSPRVLARLATVLGVTYLRLMALAGYLNETQLSEARLSESAPRPHPLTGQQLTPEEWRAVGAFIKLLLAQRKTEVVEHDS